MEFSQTKPLTIAQENVEVQNTPGSYECTVSSCFVPESSALGVKGQVSILHV